MEEESSGSNAVIWAFTVLIVVAMIVGALYFGGMMNNKKTTEVDIEIKAPTR